MIPANLFTFKSDAFLSIVTDVWLIFDFNVASPLFPHGVSGPCAYLLQSYYIFQKNQYPIQKK